MPFISVVMEEDFLRDGVDTSPLKSEAVKDFAPYKSPRKKSASKAKRTDNLLADSLSLAFGDPGRI